METDRPATVTLPDRAEPKFWSTLRETLPLPEPEDVPKKETQESPFVEDDQVHPGEVETLIDAVPPLAPRLRELGVAE